jgi:hypothetical protein
MSGIPQVFDGHNWIPVQDDDSEDGPDGPVPPVVVNDDGSIFVSIASYRGTYRTVQAG